MQVNIITLFPEMFPGVLAHSLVGKALEQKRWSLNLVNLREFGLGKHQTVDDTPYGGGAGMVIRPDVVDAALTSIPEENRGKIIYFSPRGQRLTQKMVANFATLGKLTMICGRYEGVDERVLRYWNMTEVSIGDFVLSGGELAAQVAVDACVRLLPGVLGDSASLEEESFSNGLLEYPLYTRPPVWKEQTVPEVLVSGHHAEIAKWRKMQAEEITRVNRPDLWQEYVNCKESKDGHNEHH